jgi:hypothetical protein
LPKIGEGFGEWFEALLRMKEGWVVVKKIYCDSLLAFFSFAMKL